MFRVVNCVYHGSPHNRKRAVFSKYGGGAYVAHCSFEGYIDCLNNGNEISTYNNWFRPVSYYAINDDNSNTQGDLHGASNVWYQGLGPVESSQFPSDYTYGWVEATAFSSTTTTADAIIVTNTSTGSQDFTPQVATGSGQNWLLGAGTNVQNQTYDPRIDLSVDIAGNPRPTTNVDIGAFQISEGGAATGTPIKIWTGSAWVNVNNLSYYDGGWS